MPLGVMAISLMRLIGAGRRKGVLLLKNKGGGDVVDAVIDGRRAEAAGSEVSPPD